MTCSRSTRTATRMRVQRSRLRPRKEARTHHWHAWRWIWVVWCITHGSSNTGLSIRRVSSSVLRQWWHGIDGRRASYQTACRLHRHSLTLLSIFTRLAILHADGRAQEGRVVLLSQTATRSVSAAAREERMNTIFKICKTLTSLSIAALADCSSSKSINAKADDWFVPGLVRLTRWMFSIFPYSWNRSRRTDSVTRSGFSWPTNTDSLSI